MYPGDASDKRKMFLLLAYSRHRKEVVLSPQVDEENVWTHDQ